MIASERLPIPGSERRLDPRHVRVGDIDPREQAVVSVYVAHWATPDWVDAAAREDPRTRRRIMRDDWEGEHGATAAARSYRARSGPLTIRRRWTGSSPACSDSTTGPRRGRASASPPPAQSPTRRRTDQMEAILTDAFALPAYQSTARVPDNVDTGRTGRGVPDVAADANPQTGYAIRVDGAPVTVGGTSAVAPLWAALVLLTGEPLGFVQPRLYPLLGTAAFHDITSGSNGAYSAAPGWDPCTGLGTPSAPMLTAGLRETT